MKEDEKRLLLELAARRPGPGAISGLAIARELGIPDKRAMYLFEYKWDRKGWWEWGVSGSGGWFTEAGLELVASLKEPVRA